MSENPVAKNRATVILVGQSFESDWLTLGETAAALARASDSTVELMHVLTPQRVGHQPKWEAALVDWYKQRGVTACFEWPVGRPGEVLAQRAAEPDVGMVALCGADLSAAVPGFLGSTASHLLRHGHTAVLVVPPGARRPRGHGAWRILFPTDFGAAAQAAEVRVGHWRTQLGATLELLHVACAPRTLSLRLGTGQPLGAASAALEANQDRLEATLSQVSIPGAPACERTVYVAAHAAEGIRTRAIERDVDLIILPSHGRGRVGAFLMGSVAEAVVRASDRPVLVLKPNRRRESHAD